MLNFLLQLLAYVFLGGTLFGMTMFKFAYKLLYGDRFEYSMFFPPPPGLDKYKPKAPPSKS